MKKRGELDVELMKKLYEFGCLMAYRVEYFNKDTFKIEKLPMTFSEEMVKKEMSRLKREGFKSAYYEVFVNFDGAFDLNKDKKEVKK